LHRHPQTQQLGISCIGIHRPSVERSTAEHSSVYVTWSSK